MKSRALWATISASLVSTGALAQESLPGEEEAGTIAEVTVTARKRAESLQETPIAITAFTAEGLEQRHIDDVSEIAPFTPNLIFDRAAAIGGSNSTAIVYIRGIGQDAGISTIDLGVGTYVDGIYLARSVGGVLDLVDVERLEVLRGPQGTLFGRNTIGGAINIITKKPGRDFEGDVGLTFGSDSQLNGRVSLSGALTEQLFAGITLLSKNRDGYVERPDGTDFGDENMLGARATLRWLPSDTVELNFSADITTKEENGAPFTLVDVAENAAFPSFHNAFLVPPTSGCFDFVTGMSTSAPNAQCYNDQWVTPKGSDRDLGTLPAKDDLDVLGTALSAEWRITDSLTVKSISSYRKTESEFSLDQDHSPLTIAHVATVADQEQITQELQLLGETANDRLDWILGLYYFVEEGDSLEAVTFAPVSFQSGGGFDNDSLAAFLQGTFAVTDRLSVTAGLRWTEDTKRFTPEQFILSNQNAAVPPFLIGQPGAPPVLPPPGFPLLPPDEAELRVSETTPLLNVAYMFADQLLGYVTYSEGFKSGGFIQRIFPPEPAARSFDPEFVDSYEAGLKWTGLDNRLRINGALFYMDYTDLQFVVQSDTVAPVVLNQTAAEIKGAELEIQARPTASWLIEGGVGYLDASYTDIDPDVPPSLNITPASRLVKTPEWSGSAAVAYTLYSDMGTFTPRLDVSHRADYFNNSINSSAIRQEAYTTWDLGVTYASLDDHWTVSLIGRNLSDERTISAGFSDVRFLGSSEAVYSRGREWAIAAKYRF